MISTCGVEEKVQDHKDQVQNEEVEVEVTGRHDPCVGIRAVPIAEAMVNLVVMDHLLRNEAQCGMVDQSTPFNK